MLFEVLRHAKLSLRIAGHLGTGGCSDMDTLPYVKLLQASTTNNLAQIDPTQTARFPLPTLSHGGGLSAEQRAQQGFTGSRAEFDSETGWRVCSALPASRRRPISCRAAPSGPRRRAGEQDRQGVL